ncbi:hypothetical protein SPRG_00020, partial [Saprolegnia parasitica CBS 223.65]
MHSMAGTVPMDVVELIAMQVACPSSLSALLGALPPPAVTPALAALQALTQRPTTVRVTWPRIALLSTPSASTHSHLKSLMHHDAQIELVLRQPLDILEAAVPLTAVTRVHIAPIKPLSEADGVMLHLALERAPLKRLVVNTARQDNGRWLCHVLRLLTKGRVRELVLVGDPRTSLLPTADADLQVWLSSGRSLCLRGLHVSAALAAALAQALALQSLALDRVLGLSGPVLLPASLKTLTWIFDARPLASTAVAASLLTAPRLTHLALDGGLCPDAVATALAALPALTSLRLNGLALSTSLIAALPQLQHLAHLSLSGHAFGSLAPALADALPLCGRLTSLDLRRRKLPSSALHVQRLRHALGRMPTLRRLAWTSAGVGDCVVPHLSALSLSSDPCVYPTYRPVVMDGIKSLSALVELALTENELDDRGARALGEALPRCRQLRSLDVHGNAFTSRGLDAILHGLPRSLEALNVVSRGYYWSGLDAVLTALTHAAWRSLDVAVNYEHDLDRALRWLLAHTQFVVALPPHASSIKPSSHALVEAIDASRTGHACVVRLHLRDTLSGAFLDPYP